MELKTRPLAVIVLLALCAACGSPLERAAGRLIEQARLDDPQVNETYQQNKELLESPEAVQLWIETLQSDDSPKVKRWAAVLLGNIGDETALPALTGALSANDRDLREAARDAIRRFPDEQAASAFIAALEDGTREARTIALAQLSRLRAADAVQAVAKVATLNDPLLGEAACTTLGDIGTPEAAAALARVAADSGTDVTIRRHALTNLGRIEGADDAIQELIAKLEAAKDDPAAGELLPEARALR